ncbi:hypothetical protein [Pedobacter frigoris]|uniref:hypothetical protein n=1 Tax=Pedobacter frigoris TaxID=2571272 RepID=UPI00293141D6|nr:hypothetical protein [Pedobacter frigoris]
MSASKSKVASIMLMDSIQGYKVPDRQTIQKEMNEAVEYLRNSPGISKVEKKIDLENYIVSLSFDFKSITNINNLTSSVLKKLKINAISNSSYSYDARTMTFQRSYQHTKEAVNQYSRLKPEVKNIFKEATYTSIYRFEELIINSNNPLAKVSKSKKAVMINAGMLGLINGKTDISNKIVLAK